MCLEGRTLGDCWPHWARNTGACYWLKSAFSVVLWQAHLMHPAQVSRLLEQFERVFKIVKTARVECCIRQSQLTHQHLLSFFRVVVVSEHFVEHEIQKLLIGDKQLN